MSTALHVPNLRAGYLAVCDHVLRSGEQSAPRGFKTWEVLGCSLEVEDLADTLPVGIGRHLNSEIAALEALQLIGEVSRPDLLRVTAPRFGEFAGLDGSFHGAYGLRVRGQTARVLERLRDDPDSRQAVVTIWDPALDSYRIEPDMPCTVALHLLARRGKLHLQVYMRSNDVWLGLAYDYFVFAQWLLTCARVLGLEPGRYTHHVGSLHLYERDAEKVEDLHPPTTSHDVVLPHGLDVDPTGDLYLTWEKTRLQAVTLLDRPWDVTVPGPSDVWYRRHLLRVHEKREDALS
jgi:thymidylate synthase